MHKLPANGTTVFFLQPTENGYDVTRFMSGRSAQNVGMTRVGPVRKLDIKNWTKKVDESFQNFNNACMSQAVGMRRSSRNHLKSLSTSMWRNRNPNFTFQSKSRPITVDALK